MSIKLASKTPHKKYIADVADAKQVKELCAFLRNQKDRHLEVVINGKSTKFDSVAGLKRFASGFDQAFKLALNQSGSVVKVLTDRCNMLAKETTVLQHQMRFAKHDLNEAIKKYMGKYAVMKLRKLAWEDHIAELNDDRAILKEELDKLKKSKVSRKRKTHEKRSKK